VKCYRSQMRPFDHMLDLQELKVSRVTRKTQAANRCFKGIMMQID
jgi:hypothetical protein